MTAAASLGLRSNRRPCRSINKQTYNDKSKHANKYKINMKPDFKTRLFFLRVINQNMPKI